MRRILCAVLLTALPSLSCGQSQLSRPVRIIVGFPAGGAADILARITGQHIAGVWGQPVVVDNRPGAGSTLAAALVAQAAPDGHTLLMVSSSHAATAGLYKTPYHAVDSFSAVVLAASAPQVLLANPTLTVPGVPALIELAKARPGVLNFASAGNGSTTHLAGELFNLMARVNIVHVPYRGGAPALTDLIGGQIQLMYLALPAALPQVRNAKVRAIAVTSANRAAALPQVPAIAETLPGYEATNWYGLLAPRGVPVAVVNRLNADLVKTIREPAVSRAFENQGAEPVASTPKKFEEYLRSEVAKWTKVIQEAGVRGE